MRLSEVGAARAATTPGPVRDADTWRVKNSVAELVGSKHSDAGGGGLVLGHQDRGELA